MEVSGISSSITNNVRIIRFTNERKKNALSTDSYYKLTELMENDANNDQIVASIITGTGEYFTSGNDISIAMDKLPSNMDEVMQKSNTIFRNMIKAFINYPKLIITVANGPAVGIGLTLCGLGDIAYASDTATFFVPFVKLGICAEACSSYLLPRILGRSKANEVLLLGHKMNAEEALKFHLISEIIPKQNIDQFIENLVKKIRTLPVKSLIVNKKLIIDGLKEILLSTNERESDQLLACQHSEDFFQGIMNFLSRQRKSKL